MTEKIIALESFLFIIYLWCDNLCVQAYLFNDYWEDIGTIRSFFEANLALTEHVSVKSPC